jgi:hypothetical protein
VVAQGQGLHEVHALELVAGDDPGRAGGPAPPHDDLLRADRPALVPPVHPGAGHGEGEQDGRPEAPRREEPGRGGGDQARAEQAADDQPAQGAGRGRLEGGGPGVEVQPRDGRAHDAAQRVPLDHRQDALGLPHAPVGEAQRRRLDEQRAVAHQAPHQGFLDPHQLDLGAGDLHPPPGRQALDRDEHGALPPELEAVVAEQGLAGREDPGPREGQQEGAQQRARLELAEGALGRHRVELAEELEAHRRQHRHGPGRALGEAEGDQLEGAVLDEGGVRGGGGFGAPGRRGRPLAVSGRLQRGLQGLRLGQGQGAQEAVRARVARRLDPQLDQARRPVEEVLHQLEVLDAGRVDHAVVALHQAALHLEPPLVHAVAQGGVVDRGAAQAHQPEEHQQTEVEEAHPLRAAAAHHEHEQQGPGRPGRAPGGRHEVDQQGQRVQALPGSARRRRRAAPRVRRRPLRPHRRRRGGPARRGGPRPPGGPGRGCCRRRSCRRPCRRAGARGRGRARAGPAACRGAGCGPAG